MTPTISLAAEPLDWPSPDTPVLLHRKLNPAAEAAALSVFADDRWDLTPGLFESHVPTTRLNFEAVPARFRDQVKHYLWQLINHDPPHQRRSQRRIRLALRSIAIALPRLNMFAAGWTAVASPASTRSRPTISTATSAT